MNVAPLVSNRKQVACWASTNSIVDASAANSGKYIDISKSKIAFNDSNINEDVLIHLICRLSGAIIYDGDVLFKKDDQFVNFGDLKVTKLIKPLNEMFRTFPIAKNSYWTFEIRFFDFHPLIRVQYSLIDVDQNEQAYLQDPIKPIGDSGMSVHARLGNLVLKLTDDEFLEIKNRPRRKQHSGSQYAKFDETIPLECETVPFRCNDWPR
jgi:hypothetical protein